MKDSKVDSHMRYNYIYKSLIFTRIDLMPLRNIPVLLFLMVIACTSVRIVEENTIEGQARYSLKKSIFLKNEVKIGDYTLWYNNGAKKLLVTYVDGFKQGTETLWDAFGVKIRETVYYNGVKDGIEILWNSNGTKRRETSYKNDLQDGPDITFFPSGKKEKEENYLKGIKDGKEIGYDENGNKIYEASYVSGLKSGSEIFYENRDGSMQVIQEIKWKNGEAIP